MITKNQAVALKGGAILHHATLKNRDGTPLRVRVNGKCRTWETRPEHFLLPVKYGMYKCFYVTHTNANHWSISAEEN